MIIFIAPAEKYQEFLDILERPAQDMPKLSRLLSSPSPWDENKPLKLRTTND